MRYHEICEDWNHYTEIGHKKKSSIVWHMMPGGKLITHPYMRKSDNHSMSADGLQGTAIAVGRIDPDKKKISIRPPIAMGNSWYALDDRKLHYVAKRLRAAYPDYEIWYFGNAASDIRKIDEAQIVESGSPNLLYHGTVSDFNP